MKHEIVSLNPDGNGSFDMVVVDATTKTTVIVLKLSEQEVRDLDTFAFVALRKAGLEP